MAANCGHCGRGIVEGKPCRCWQKLDALAEHIKAEDTKPFVEDGPGEWYAWFSEQRREWLVVDRTDDIRVCVALTRALAKQIAREHNNYARLVKLIDTIVEKVCSDE